MRFTTGIAVALFGATVFLFNSSYPAHMIVGHLPWHSIALTPLIAFCLLYEAPAEGDIMRSAVGALTAGLLFSYMFQSGNIHIIIPMFLAVVTAG